MILVDEPLFAVELLDAEPEVLLPAGEALSEFRTKWRVPLSYDQ